MRAFATLFIAFCTACLCTPAAAQSVTEVSLYGHSGDAGGSGVNLNDPGGAGTLSFGAGWEVPNSAGMRVVWWSTNGFGWGVDFNNQGVSADNETLVDNGLSELSLESGTSLFTLNAYRRWEAPNRPVAPYLGAGVGVAVPVVRYSGGGLATERRQVTGPAFQFVAGAKYPLRSGVSVFGEYQGSISVNSANLANNGFLNTTTVGSGVNFGISLDF